MESGLTEIDLSQFTGKPLEHYSNAFVVEALAQAGDLLELAARITEMPDPGTLIGRLARRGVLAMAEALFEGNAYRDLRFTPFRSETIGSYTYSLAEGQISQGIPTGISWFDLAVARLLEEVEAGSAISNSSIAAFDRPGDVVDVHGRPILVGPADTQRFRQGWFGLDDSGAQPR